MLVDVFLDTIMIAPLQGNKRQNSTHLYTTCCVGKIATLLSLAK